MKFSISGMIVMGDAGRKFTKSIEAKSESDAKEKVYALFGSLNNLKRTKIKINEVKKVQ